MRDFEKEKEGILARINSGLVDFKNLHPFFKRDRDIVLATVKKNGMNLRYADKCFVNDMEIINEAIISNPFIMQHLRNKYKSDKSVVIKGLTNHDYFYSGAYQFIPKNLKADEDILGYIYKRNPFMYRFLPKSLRSDRILAKQFIEQNGICLAYATREFKNDFELCVIACKGRIDAIKFVGDKVLADPRFALEIIESLNPKELFIGTTLKALPEHIVKLYNKDTNLSFLREAAKIKETEILKNELDLSMPLSSDIRKKKHKI